MSLSPYWIILLLSCVVEIAWAVSIKFTTVRPLVAWPVAIGLTALNMTMLSFAMRGIPAGTAYAVWTGLGAVGVAAIGIIALGEPLGWTRLFFMAVIVVGVVGLKAASQA